MENLSPPTTTINGRTILVYVALSEEFHYVLEVLGSDFKPEESDDIAITYFFGYMFSPRLNTNFLLVVVPAGKMGNTRYGKITSALISTSRPLMVVVLGIAGSYPMILSLGMYSFLIVCLNIWQTLLPPGRGEDGLSRRLEMNSRLHRD